MFLFLLLAFISVEFNAKLPENLSPPSKVYYSKTQTPGKKSNVLPDHKIGKIITPEMFGAKGDNISNDLPAFKKAMALAKKIGGATIRIGAGKTYFLDFPKVDGNKFIQSIQVPSNTMIIGGKGATIRWRATTTHICFDFFESTLSGIMNVKLQYNGVMPDAYRQKDVEDYNALHGTKMSIGGDNFGVWINAYGADYLSLKNLVFESKTQHPDSCINMCIRLYQHTNGTATKGVTIDNIKFRDYQMGIGAQAQQDLTVSNITGDWRTAKRAYPPGHMIYLTGRYDLPRNTNFKITNFYENPNVYKGTLEGGGNIGTLAIKFCRGGSISKITSLHPTGLVHSIQTTENVDFTDMYWKSSYPSGIPIINGTDSVQNVTFRNIHTINTVFPVRFWNTSGEVTTGVTFDGVYMECPSFNSTNKWDLIALRGTGYTIKNFIWRPTSIDSTAAQVGPLDYVNNSSNNNVQIKIVGQYAKYVDNEVLAGMNSQAEAKVLGGNVNEIKNNLLAPFSVKSVSIGTDILAQSGYISGPIEGASNKKTIQIKLPYNGTYSLNLSIASTDRLSSANGIFTLTADSTGTDKTNVIKQTGNWRANGKDISAPTAMIGPKGIITISWTQTAGKSYGLAYRWQSKNVTIPR